MYPFVQNLRNEPILVIVLKMFFKDFDSLSGTAFTKSIEISKGYIEVLFSLRIFAST